MSKNVYFDRESEKFANLTDEIRNNLEKEFPTVDLIDELKSMKLWLLGGNPQAKKIKGSLTWIKSWLAAARDVGRVKHPSKKLQPLDGLSTLNIALNLYRSDLWQNQSQLLNSNSMSGRKR